MLVHVGSKCEYCGDLFTPRKGRPEQKYCKMKCYALSRRVEPPPEVDGEPTKLCRRCRQVKLLTEFHQDQRKSDGRQPWCRECGKQHLQQWRKENPEQARAHDKRHNRKKPARTPESKAKHKLYMLKHRYNLDASDHAKLIAIQGNRCAICRRPSDDVNGLHVDHDHQTDQVRGLLCVHCNRAIGCMGDDPARLREAAEYVERGGTRIP